ncbi:MAG TPA: Na+/H+ antiporter NhaA [Burkholderiaceae bacterium]|jgi:NhaA family Na+:H+ antiporter|nr:Na+/H+ antiporter NhaA [Burkholderiaceae bacterium]HRA78255.1 Na+/H+ antiporter NhaA [Burkholderiaceae bacterium]
MNQPPGSNRLDRPVETGRDHVLGDAAADLTLVEYGSYACPYCRAANEEIAALRDRFGERLRYVFRQRPVTDSVLARRAADLAESTADEEAFWRAHVELMTRSHTLTEDDLREVAGGVVFDRTSPDAQARAMARGAARVDADVESARNSGVSVTPTFFINGRRYDGPWDRSSLAEAMLGSLGHRVHAAAVDFARWAPSTGLLLLAMSVLAVALVNSPLGAAFAALWQTPLGFAFGSTEFRMPLLHWVNDAMLTVFFLVVGLEIKREFTVGRLASRRSAALPIAAAIGGMTVPAAVYLAVIPAGPWQPGWGVPMATDTAFAVALIAMLGARVPVELRVFLTAAAIVDDIGAILVVALFYSGELHWAWLIAAAAAIGTLALLNRLGVYRAMPYALTGVALWAGIHAAGLHATLAGVLLAFFVPTRPPPNLQALMAQADAILGAESKRGPDVLRHGPSEPALRALDAIHDRLESPADRVLRAIEPWSSYLVLPLFALANAGVTLSAGAIDGRAPLVGAIVLGLLLGKPVGLLLGAALAVASGIATKPVAYSWRQLAGAGALAGIGFTMSLFIAGQAFPDVGDFAAAKLAVFAASALSAAIGVALLLQPRG